MFPVMYELGSYIPEHGILLKSYIGNSGPYLLREREKKYNFLLH
jgi:hypothetical protein